MAMKYAKTHRLPYFIYEDNLGFEDIYEKNIKISTFVRNAINNDKIVAYYQPIVDNKTGRISKFEVLARLIGENGEVISPSEFLEVSKKVKLYNEITKKVINSSFKEFEHKDYEFSINLLLDDIEDNDIFEFIIEKLKNSKISNKVVFEFVESEAVGESARVLEFITEIKRYGAKVAIDDFGLAYSNFSVLLKLKVDFIKIDGSLIQNIDKDKNSYLIVETIVEFAKKLGIKTIAEYVHSSSVQSKMKMLGVDYSQGFFIDKPSIKVF
jgi:EAL domain-containing protein (putative c-di-GMP-specific phosphodiesterase class I)